MGRRWCPSETGCIYCICFLLMCRSSVSIRLSRNKRANRFIRRSDVSSRAGPGQSTSSVSGSGVSGSTTGFDRAAGPPSGTAISGGLDSREATMDTVHRSITRNALMRGGATCMGSRLRYLVSGAEPSGDSSGPSRMVGVSVLVFLPPTEWRSKRAAAGRSWDRMNSVGVNRVR